MHKHWTELCTYITTADYRIFIRQGLRVNYSARSFLIYQLGVDNNWVQLSKYAGQIRILSPRNG
jgi:hypothetical protein